MITIDTKFSLGDRVTFDEVDVARINGEKVFTNTSREGIITDISFIFEGCNIYDEVYEIEVLINDQYVFYTRSVAGLTLKE